MQRRRLKRWTDSRRRTSLENRFRFFAPVQVRYAETDMQGHVFFGHYFAYFDIGLIEYLRATG
jgi:acyl-CoA thioester hydrolase